MARSTRQRKPVNYRQLLDASGDSDDDFASGPPPKRPRGGGTVESSEKKDLSREAQLKSTTTEETSKKVGRLSRDEKVFSRQLEEAIKASKIESSDGDEGRSESQESVVPASKTVVSEPPKSTSKGSKVDDDEFVPDKTTCSSIESSEEEEESYSAADEDEDSDFSMSPEPKKGRKGARESAKSAPKGKKTAVKKATSVKSEKVTAKSSSRKITKSQAVKVKSEAQNLPANVPKTLSVCIDKKASVPVGRATGHGTSPAVLGVNKRAVNWTPPSRIGESNTKNGSCTPIPTRVQSGGGGTPLIRVGLSRNARVKSLHTNIKTCT